MNGSACEAVAAPEARRCARNATASDRSRHAKQMSPPGSSAKQVLHGHARDLDHVAIREALAFHPNHLTVDDRTCGVVLPTIDVDDEILF